MSQLMSRRLLFDRAGRRRAGFTLVELLVVIAIIGTLVSLLLPAVQSAREAARRMSCSNNLHNIAIAVQNYHDSVGSFPSAYFFQYDEPPNKTADPNETESWGWGALVLPFLEQKNLHTMIGVTTNRLRDQLDPSVVGANGAAQTKTGVTTPLQIFMCPSDSGFDGRGLTVNRSFAIGLGSSKIGLTATSVSNYIGVGGHRDTLSNRLNRNAAKNTGVFVENAYMRMSDIVDGTSNTFLVGERETLECKSGTWVGVRNPPGGGTGSVGLVIGHSRPKLNQSSIAIAWNVNSTGCGEGFSSLHPNGAQFASCDGSVRFVSNNIEWRWYNNNLEGHKDRDSQGKPIGVYQALMSRNDKVPVGDF